MHKNFVPVQTEQRIGQTPMNAMGVLSSCGLLLYGKHQQVGQCRERDRERQRERERDYAEKGGSRAMQPFQGSAVSPSEWRWSKRT